MRIVIFKSEPQPHLRAFTEDPGGRALPAQFGPWSAVGVVRPGNDLPHKLDRGVVEKAINSNGYQLWRIKSEKKDAASGSGRG
jgi:hypothetical protein